MWRHQNCTWRKETPHQCPSCNANFKNIECEAVKTSNQLKVHINAFYERMKPQKCSIWKKNHINSAHEGNKPNKCSICDKNFALKHQLNLQKINKKTDSWYLVKEIFGDPQNLGCSDPANMLFIQQNFLLKPNNSLLNYTIVSFVCKRIWSLSFLLVLKCRKWLIHITAD